MILVGLTNKDEEFFSYGSHLILSKATNRPIFGKIVFNLNVKVSYSMALSYLIHEIIHILGFSYDLFPLLGIN
jgi:hypothetical protein